MPTERLSMRRIRDVLRLKYAQGMSECAIAASLGLGKGTVGVYLSSVRRAGLGWPLPQDLDDDGLELLLFPASPTVPDPGRPVPYWAEVDRELRRPGVTRALLWEEYRAAYAQTAVAPYAVRARPKAPVATPLRWEEAFAADMTPDRYTIASIFRRLGQTGDPWAAIDDDPLDASRLVG